MINLDHEKEKAATGQTVSGCREEISHDKAEAEQIEVTQEMIDAGALALAKFTGFYNTPEEGALSIFTAMMAAKMEALSVSHTVHLSKLLRLR